ncbi:DoxX family protein [Goodfellowiella coeruleoviolacea]|uniref:Membrane protein YphA, DoxX/SURF4 family n=1 Tax=Goodfellowiella coeruleoviolacea TaxID=334858 RepID=A0AAE3KEQ2_9PSEU|nr:DoxX family protein [Goodfellowiella coeruleoviolacea]MCP2164075.1 putative membrane protein YphA, DoxX/SURF4 family [Goodfellowiella coeruleoviolacea]
MKLVHLVARPLLAWIFVSGGLDTLRNPEPRAQLAGPSLDKMRETVPVLPEDNLTLVRVNAAVQVGAGILLALGKFRRLAALALAASIVPTTYAGHRFWEVEDEAGRAQQRIHFDKNLAILGGLLVAASEGRSTRRARRRAAAELDASA